MTEQTNDALGNNQNTGVAGDANQATSLVDVFGEWGSKAGVGTKYKTPEDLAKGKVFADEHINRLEGELGELKTVLSEVVGHLKTTNNSQAVLEEIKQLKAQKENTNSSIGDADLKQLVMNVLNETSTEQKAKTNLAQANSVLNSKFGADAKVKVAEKAQELGVSPSWLTDMAASSPTAFLKLFDVSSQPSSIPASPSVSTLNTQAIAINQNKPLAGSYEEFKQNALAQGLKKNSQAYWSAFERQFRGKII